MTRKELRCEECNTLLAVLENGAVIIEARHHGERHTTTFSLATLWALAHGEAGSRVSVTAEPSRDGHKGGPLR